MSLLSDSSIGKLAGHHLVEDAAQEVDVGARVALGAIAGALECRVVDGALALDARLGFVISLHGGQAEIDELGFALVGDQDVGSLDVAVGHALLERVLQPPGHSQHEGQRPGRSGCGCAAS